MPLWKQRIAGKSLPIEKFCVKKCERFIAQKENLVLPAIELLYVWNYFKVFGKKWDLSQAVYKLILKHLSEYERGKCKSFRFPFIKTHFRTYFDEQNNLLGLDGVILGLKCMHIWYFLII